MKLKSIKNIAIIAGLLSLGLSLQARDLKLLTPVTDAEELVIDGFCKEIPANDKRSFNHIVNEIVTLIKNNMDYFKKMVQGKEASPDSYINDFMEMLKGLKSKTNAMAIVTQLNKYKKTFDALMPRAMGELLRYPLKTLSNLKERIKRN